jgi:diacylglycerol kinase
VAGPFEHSIESSGSVKAGVASQFKSQTNLRCHLLENLIYLTFCSLLMLLSLNQILLDVAISYITFVDWLFPVSLIQPLCAV